MAAELSVTGRRRRGGGKGEGIGGDGGEGFLGPQQMRGMPPLQNDNQYACLEVEEIDDSLDIPELPVMPETPKIRTRRPNWEKRLPKEYKLAASPTNRSLRLLVQLQTTDTQLVKATQALLDCGATGLFISKDYAKKEQIETKKLSTPIPVRNVDGTLNEDGPITEVAEQILHC